MTARTKKAAAPPAKKQQRHGKPPIGITPKDLEGLGRIRCTKEEAAAVIGCSIVSIKRYLRKPEFREAWDRGHLLGKASLRRLQVRHANGKGSSAVQMTIHMSKHWLGETDKSLIELEGKGGLTPVLVKIAKEDEKL